MDHCPTKKSVTECDIIKGLPFSDNTFDAVYSSHMIEHLDNEVALSVLKEIFRVMKVGAICRIVVPDYQDCVNEYLRVLERAMKNEDGVNSDYRWIVIEMIDQFTRTTYGGKMKRYIASNPKNLAYVESRIGAVKVPSLNLTNPGGLFNRLISAGWLRIFEKIRFGVARAAVNVFCGRKYEELFMEAVFRSSGELHKSMWDGYSLKKLFDRAGFFEVRRCTAFESGIEGFEKYGLDFSLVDSKSVFRPHSIYMEAKKA